MKRSAALLGVVVLATSNTSGAYRLLSKPESNEFVVPESQLNEMMDDPPSFSSLRDAGSSPPGASMDVISLGSIRRLDYLTGQILTWASHRMVRHFWGLSELQDYDPQCGGMS
jgi:hypothetical protein